LDLNRRRAGNGMTRRDARRQRPSANRSRYDLA